MSRYSKELLELPAQPVAAELVLRLVSDPQTSAESLARVVETDLALAARIIRVANSLWYGAPRRVSSVPQAVRLLGFETVRALAVSAACSLLDESTDEHVRPGSASMGFWRHAVTTAAACSVCARRVGFSTADAFSAGLLHDIGAVLLHRRDPARFEQAQHAEGGTTSAILAAELDAFGITHPMVGAAAAEAWLFPAAFVEAIACHHGTDEPQWALGQLVRIGEAIALAIEASSGHASVQHEPELLDRLLPTIRVPLARREALLDDVRHELTRVAELLGASRG
jgi:putative nucleotidyltransferase with HDIG domain